MGHMEGSGSCSKLRPGSAYSAILGMWAWRPPPAYRKLESEQEHEMSLESCTEDQHIDTLALILLAKDSHIAAPCQWNWEPFHLQWEESQSSMSKARMRNSIRVREWELGSSINCFLGNYNGHHHSARTPSWSLFNNCQSANLTTSYVLQALWYVGDVRIYTPKLVSKDLLSAAFETNV